MQGSLKPEPLRTRIYIDGYNFYYGCLRGTPHKWLDLLPLFENHILPSALVKDHDGHIWQSMLLPNPAIKYFTAKIIESVARAPDSVSSQARYHTALRKLYDGRVELIEGYYAVNKMKVKIVDAEDPGKMPRECQEIQAWKVEEKQSDVNLALQVYHDAMTQQIDHAVIVTNDTDIAPALQMIREHTRVLIGVVVPTSQLPRVIPGRKPTTKPESWYGQPELLQDILELAIPVRGSKAAVFKWMEQSNPHLGGERPIELAETVEGASRVLEYIRNWIVQSAQSPAPDE